MPERLIQAFLSAEDKNFYQHSGIDWARIGRALVQNVQGVIEGNNRRFIGASTITQQVTKNFLLSGERTSSARSRRRSSPAARAGFTKDEILELYLNQIFLGPGSYGVAAAALNYFGKSLNELRSCRDGLSCGPAQGARNYQPVNRERRAIERRNWVLDRMAENGYINKEEHDGPVRSLVVTARRSGRSPSPPSPSPRRCAASSPHLYGEDKLV